MKYLVTDTETNDLCFSDELEQLRDAVVISIFTWRRSNDGDLPADAFRWGWWSDTYNNFRIGSRLYLLHREKISEALLQKIDSIVAEALQWMIDDDVVSEVLINSQRIGVGTIQTSITIIRNSETLLTLDFDNIWKQYE